MFGSARLSLNRANPVAAAGGGNDPYAANVELLYKGEDLTDSSGNGRTLTAQGNAASSATKAKFGTKSLFSDGNDRFFISGSQGQTYLNCGTGDFCVDFWINFSSITTDNQYFFGTGSYTGSTGSRQWLNYAYDAGVSGTLNDSRIKFLDDPNGNGFPGFGVNQVLSNDVWYHFALTRSGTAMKLYIDGVEKVDIGAGFSGGLSAGESFNFGGQTDFSISGDVNGTEYGFNGYIDHFRFTKGQVRYTTGFTPPTINDYS
jgi:hypothetical protein